MWLLQHTEHKASGCFPCWPLLLPQLMISFVLSCTCARGCVIRCAVRGVRWCACRDGSALRATALPLPYGRMVPAPPPHCAAARNATSTARLSHTRQASRPPSPSGAQSATTRISRSCSRAAGGTVCTWASLSRARVHSWSPTSASSPGCPPWVKNRLQRRRREERISRVPFRSASTRQPSRRATHPPSCLT